MKIGFYHDTIFSLKGGYYYTRSLGTYVWDRYLSVFDNLMVCARLRHESSFGTSVSNHPNVTFFPITAYVSPKSLFTQLPMIVKQIKASLMEVDGAIIRLPSMIGWLTWVIAKRMQKPILIELVGCPWDAYRFHSGKGKLLAPLAFLLTRLAVRDALFVIYVTKEFLQKRYPTKGRSVPISNVNLEVDFALIEKRLLKSTTLMEGRGNKKPVILGSIGNVDLRYKGFESAIHAVAKLVERGYLVQLQIVGGGDPRSLNRLIESLNLNAYVQLMGLFSADQVSGWLEEIDIYVQPSLTEGLPRAAIEAMSHGLPAILSDVGGHSELLAEEFLYKSGDVKELTDRLLRVLEFPTWEGIIKENFNTVLKYESSHLQSIRENFLLDFHAYILHAKKKS